MMPVPDHEAGLVSLSLTLKNRQLAELLAVAAEDAEGNKQKALRRASRHALIWPEEIADVLEGGRPLTPLSAIGPWVARVITQWTSDPPDVPQEAPIRADFLTFPEVEETLAASSWQRDLRGDLQMHSTYSDGATSIAEMATACVAKGYDYIAITDHSKGLRIAGGIDEGVLAFQGDEIERLNGDLARAGADLRVLRSLEMNLGLDGEGDMDPGALERLDLVLGSFHSQLRKKEDQTERYVAAIRNPHVNVLGHPRGRKYNQRVGLVAEWRRVFDEAARLDKAVEIDAYPDRQDLNVELLKVARQAGVRISIGTDAHNPDELQFIGFGLAAALRAGIEKERILNFLPLDELLAWAGGTAGG